MVRYVLFSHPGNNWQGNMVRYILFFHPGNNWEGNMVRYSIQKCVGRGATPLEFLQFNTEHLISLLH